MRNGYDPFPTNTIKAVESLNIICGILSTEQVEQYFVPLIERLAIGDWFTSRSSSAGLFAVAYGKATPSNHDKLRQLFNQLCQDETPMVRRAAATNLAVSNHYPSCY